MALRVDSGGVAPSRNRGAVKPPPPPAPPRPAPPAPPAPSIQAPISYSAPLSGYSGGGGGGGGAGAAAAVAPPPPPPNPNAYLTDPDYIAQIAALKAQAENYNTDFNQKTGAYNTQFQDALRNLGFLAPAAGAKDDPSTPNIDESKGGWAWDDQNTAAGRGFTNQKNDFASRGLMQSSLYAQAFNDLIRSLSDQNTSLNNAKTSYLNGLSNDKAQFQSQNNYQQSQAASEAKNRLANQYYASLLNG
jgi:hypothetical protein